MEGMKPEHYVRILKSDEQGIGGGLLREEDGISAWVTITARHRGEEDLMRQRGINLEGRKKEKEN